MAILTETIAKIAALLVAVGLPAGQSTLWALIVIYLLVTALLAVFMLALFVRRRNCARQKRMASPPDRES